MSGDRPDAVTVDTTVGGIRAAPARIALGVLSIGTTLWTALVIAPLALLAGVLLFPIPAVIGMQTALAVLFILWMSSAGYNRSRTTIDPGERTVSIDRPSGVNQRKTDVHDLEAVEIIEIQQLGSVVFVSIESDASLLTASEFVASESELPAVVDALRAAGVTIVESEIGRSGGGSAASGPLARLVATPVILLGVPIAILAVFGPSPVGSGVFWLLMVGTITVVGGRLLRWLTAD